MHVQYTTSLIFEGEGGRKKNLTTHMLETQLEPDLHLLERNRSYELLEQYEDEAIVSARPASGG